MKDERGGAPEYQNLLSPLPPPPLLPPPTMNSRRHHSKIFPVLTAASDLLFLLVRVASPLKVFLQHFCCNLIRRPLVCSGLVPQGRFRKKKNPSQRSRSSGCDVETLPIREEVEVGVWGGWLLCCPADRLPSPNFLILFSRHTPPSRFHSFKPCVPPPHILLASPHVFSPLIHLSGEARRPCIASLISLPSPT